MFCARTFVLLHKIYSMKGKRSEQMNRGGKKVWKTEKKQFQHTPKETYQTKDSRQNKKLIRLNKLIANAGICSRREADVLIQSGVVTVNGKVVTELGTKVPEDAEVRVDGQLLRKEPLRYILLNKPKNVITTCSDPRGRITVMDLIKGACRERVYPVGRLDRDTTGLLILTNDGELARKLMHPSSRIKKVYEVTLDKRLTPEDFEKIKKGVWLDEKTFVEVDDLAYVDGTVTGKVIGIELHSGQYHVVKRIFEKFGYRVIKLDRTRIDILTKKNLPRGRWRFLTETEVQLLKRF